MCPHRIWSKNTPVSQYCTWSHPNWGWIGSFLQSNKKHFLPNPGLFPFISTIFGALALFCCLHDRVIELFVWNFLFKIVYLFIWETPLILIWQNAYGTLKSAEGRDNAKWIQCKLCRPKLPHVVAGIFCRAGACQGCSQFFFGGGGLGYGAVTLFKQCECKASCWLHFFF